MRNILVFITLLALSACKEGFQLNGVERSRGSSSVTQIRSHGLTNETDIHGQYLSVALAYENSTETPINLTVGSFALNADHTLQGRLFSEDARDDLTPFYSSKPENLMVVNGSAVSCTPQRIPIPGVFRSLTTVTGSWSLSSSAITISLPSVTFTVNPDSAVAANAYRVASVSGYSVWRGYGFMSEQDPFAFPTLNDSQIFSFYSGEMESNRPAIDGTTFNHYAAEMNWHGLSAQSDPDIRSATNSINDGFSQYGFQDLARNMPGFPSNIIFQSNGHDFNNDHCANDGGHEAAYFGIPSNGKMAQFLYVESSYTGSNTPAFISVGRVMASGVQVPGPGAGSGAGGASNGNSSPGGNSSPIITPGKGSCAGACSWVTNSILDVRCQSAGEMPSGTQLSGACSDEGSANTYEWSPGQGTCAAGSYVRQRVVQTCVRSSASQNASTYHWETVSDLAIACQYMDFPGSGLPVSGPCYSEGQLNVYEWGTGIAGGCNPPTFLRNRVTQKCVKD